MGAVFQDDGAKVLWRLSSREIRCGWAAGGDRKRLHEIVEFLRVSDAETVWREQAMTRRRRRRRVCKPSPAASGRHTLPVGEGFRMRSCSMENAVDSVVGVGLQMLRGEIDTVRLRSRRMRPTRGSAR